MNHPKDFEPKPVLPPSDPQVSRRLVNALEDYYEDEVRFRWVWVAVGFVLGVVLTAIAALHFMGGNCSC